MLARPPRSRGLPCLLGLLLAVTVPAAQGPRFRALHDLPVAAQAPAHPLGAWVSFRNGPSNPGRAAVAVRDLAGSTSGRSPRSFATQGLIWGTPVVDAQDHVYVGSADKVFYSLDASGGLRWTYTLPDAGDSLIDSAAALAPGNLVVVPGGDGSLHALDRDTGALRWRFDAYHADDHEDGSEVNSFEGNVVLGPDGNLYAGSDNGHLYSVDLEGQERWNVETGMMIWSAPAFEPGGEWLAFGSLDNRLYAVRLSDGEVLATAKVSGEIKSSPTIDDVGRIYVGASDFSFRCFELLPGRLWGHRLREVWEFDTRGEVYSSPARADGKVVFGSHDGYVYCLTLDGEEVWRYGAHSRISASPLVTADGVVVVGAKNGTLYALDLETGERLWSYQAAPGSRKVNLDSSPAIDSTGRLHVGSYDGRVYSVPYEYALQHPSDPRVDLDPGPDLPDFGGPVPHDGATLRVLGEDGAYHLAPPAPVAPEAGLTFAVVAMDDGRYTPNAALSAAWLDVEVDPPTPVDVVVSSDSYFLNVQPRTFWRPDTEYTLRVRGRWFHRGNPFLDALKWFQLPALEVETTFSTDPAGGPVPTPPPGTALRYAVGGMYAAQPEILDTLIPAALDGQAFLASVPFRDDARGRLGVVVLPAYPRPGGLVLRPAPDKVFTLNGDAQGSSVRLVGDFRLSAMGGTIPFAPFRMTGRMTEDGIEDGRFHATANLLGIKGNGSTYFGLSWSNLDDMADPLLRLQAFGSLRAERLSALAVPMARGPLEWTGRERLLVPVHAPGGLAGDHLVTVAFWDPEEARVSGQATLVLDETLGAGPRTLVFEGLERAALRDHEVVVLFDGERVPETE